MVPFPEIRTSPIERRRLPSGGMDEEDENYVDPDDDDLGLMSPILSAARRCRRGHQQQRQLSIESYYSIASEGDGDIFASAEHLGLVIQHRRAGLNRQASFCLPDTNISDYSEFNNEDFNSSISELFARGGCQSGGGGGSTTGSRRCRLGTQGTFSEQGSIRSLSIDQEDIIYEVPGMRTEEQSQSMSMAPDGASSDPTGPLLLLSPTYTGADVRNSGGGDFPDFLDELPFDDEAADGYISSSCSISMSSEPESSHQITVPVFIEPAPPEIRFLFEDDEDKMEAAVADGTQYTGRPTGGAEEGDLGGLLLLGSAGGGGGRLPASRLVHQETMHTDSGLDTEDICPASPTNSRYSRSNSPMPPLLKGTGGGGGGRHLAAGEDEDEEEEGEEQHLRLVLVRDIGIQCCAAESPNLSGNRRQRSVDSNTSGGLNVAAASTDKYPPELLF